MSEKFEYGPLNTEPVGPYEYWPGTEKVERKASRVPKNAERPAVTTEVKEKMDRELIALGNLMQNSSVWWQLDGALNISLLKGKYIGAHADVDISVMRDGINKLDEHLSSMRYGLFLTKKEGEARIYRRVSAKDFDRRDWDWQMCLAAIDEQGKIRFDADLPIIDVAVIEKGDKGEAIGWRGTVMPKRWLEGKIIDFHGTKINLSSPARLLFYKILFTRTYDLDDLKQLAETGELTLQDIQEVKTAVDPILKDFAEDPRIGKAHADLILERLNQISKWTTENSIESSR